LVFKRKQIISGNAVIEYTFNLTDSLAPKIQIVINIKLY